MLKALWGIIRHIPYTPTCNNALTYFFDISFELKYQAKVLQIGRNVNGFRPTVVMPILLGTTPVATSNWK